MLGVPAKYVPVAAAAAVGLGDGLLHNYTTLPTEHPRLTGLCRLAVFAVGVYEAGFTSHDPGLGQGLMTGAAAGIGVELVDAVAEGKPRQVLAATAPRRTATSPGPSRATVGAGAHAATCSACRDGGGGHRAHALVAPTTAQGMQRPAMREGWS